MAPKSAVPVGKVEKPGPGWAKSAGVVVEGREILLKVHFHPLAPRLLRVPCGNADKFGADATAL
jgi:hypothetical protein